jgi:HK97 family phage major capsid protein
MYLGASTAEFGTSGTQMTDGIHTVVEVAVNSVSPTYAQIVALGDALPAQYWGMPTTAWHMTPKFIKGLRNLADEQGLPKFLELGEKGEGGAVGSIFGAPVIINPYLNDIYPVYLANWNRFLQIADVEEMTIQTFEQTTPGFLTLWCEKRMVSTIRDPFAGVRGVD